MNIWGERQKKSMHTSTDWQTKTKRTPVGMPSRLNSHAFPTLDAAHKAEIPINKDYFYANYKMLAYSIAYEQLPNMPFTPYSDYFNHMVDFFVQERNEHIEHLRLNFSSAKNTSNFLKITQAEYKKENAAIQAWAKSLVNDLKEEGNISSPIDENPWTDVSRGKRTPARTGTENQSTFVQHTVPGKATEAQKMSWQDELEPLGVSTHTIKKFYEQFPKMKHKSLNTVARNIFNFEETLNSSEREVGVNELGSGLHEDMQYAGAYAAPACHPMAYAAPACHALTYAAPVAYADAHGMAVAAAACHPITYSAPVGYGDAHAFTCAAPGPFNRSNKQELNGRKAAQNRKKKSLN